jgi:hypothetical protein
VEEHLVGQRLGAERPQISQTAAGRHLVQAELSHRAALSQRSNCWTSKVLKSKSWNNSSAAVKAKQAAEVPDLQPPEPAMALSPQVAAHLALKLRAVTLRYLEKEKPNTVT